MRKLLALAVMATALTIGSVAQATVFIDVTQTGTAASTSWNITVGFDAADAATRVGGIALLGGPNLLNLTFNAGNPGISPPDSGLVPDVLGDGTTNAMSINNSAAGVAIATAAGIGSPANLLGTLTINPFGCTSSQGAAGSLQLCSAPDVRLGDELFGYTASRDDASASKIDNVVVRQFAISTPEPMSMLLLGLGLGSLALLRRKAA